MQSFWIETCGRKLAQGDFLRNCAIPLFDPKFGVPGNRKIGIAETDLIVITQSCDLENNKIQFVALCPLYSIKEFTATNKSFNNIGKLEDIRKGRLSAFHLLGNDET